MLTFRLSGLLACFHWNSASLICSVPSFTTWLFPDQIPQEYLIRAPLQPNLQQQGAAHVPMRTARMQHGRPQAQRLRQLILSPWDQKRIMQSVCTQCSPSPPVLILFIHPGSQNQLCQPGCNFSSGLYCRWNHIASNAIPPLQCLLHLFVHPVQHITHVCEIVHFEALFLGQ